MSVWMTARGAGLSALVLLSLSTALGALVSRQGAATSRSAARRYVVQYLHRSTAGLGLLVLTLHVVTILADSYAHVGWRGAVVPFTSGYRPTWVGLGTLAAYLFLGVAVLGLARGRMTRTDRGARTWRRLHALAYAGWGAAVLHGFTSGTDSSLTWVRAIYVLCLTVVLASIAFRVLAERRRATAGRFAHLAGPPRPDASRPDPSPRPSALQGARS